MILGTVAYMSPEQAEGQSVDSRSDIFSFGAIMYEMLSGQRAFKANSTPGTLAAVINLDPPPLTAVSPAIPPSVERVVSRCLRKDVSRRSQHASDIKLALEELQEETSSASVSTVSVSAASAPVAVPAPAPPRPRSMAAPLVVGGLVVVLAIAGAIATRWRPEPAPSAPTAFAPVPLTSLPGSENNPSFSPDGNQVAFTWTREGDTKADLHVQLIGSTGTPLRLTDDDHNHGSAAWSPDGQSIALWHGPRGWSTNVAADIRLVLVSPLGGAERQVLEWKGAPRRIAWSPDGQWIATSPVGVRELRDKGVTLISPATGERVEWAAIDKSFAGSSDPTFSADGRRMAYIVQRDDFMADVFVASVGAGGRPVGQPVRVSNAGQSARLGAWTADGEHLLLGNGFPSSNGSVVRVRVGGSESFQPLPGLERPSALAISRDGKRLAIARGNLDADVWRVDLGNPAASGPIVRSTLHEEGADYSPDGKRIVFSSNRSGAREIWVADITGENALALTQFGGPVPGSARWSPDGRDVVFDAGRQATPKSSRSRRAAAPCGS
jgi:Tol biopolymer transport system component